MSQARYIQKSLGLSMLEFVISLLIITIIMSLAIPKLMSIQQNAEKTVLWSALQSIRATSQIFDTLISTSAIDENGFVEIENQNILLINRFPVARDQDISKQGPGRWRGILAIIQFSPQIEVLYSNTKPQISESDIPHVRLILKYNHHCVFYQPPLISGNDAIYSKEVLTYYPQTQACA